MSWRVVYLKMLFMVIFIIFMYWNIGKVMLVMDVCVDIGLYIYSIDVFDIISDDGGGGGDVKMEGFFRICVE